MKNHFTDRMPLFMQTTLLAFKFLTISLTLKLSCFSAEIVLFFMCTQSMVPARELSSLWRSLKAENLAVVCGNVASKPMISTASPFRQSVPASHPCSLHKQPSRKGHSWVLPTPTNRCRKGKLIEQLAMINSQERFCNPQLARIIPAT